MKKSQNLMVNLITLAITFLLIFFAFELFFRIFYPQPTLLRADKISLTVFEESDYTPWKLKPGSFDYQISGTGREFNVPVSINSQGLREDEISQNSLQNQTIMAAIGDSFTYGYGVSLEESYHQQLELILTNEKSDVRIINMGRADGALTTDVQYLYLKKKGLSFNPQLVILGYYAGNDITDLGKKTKWIDIDNNGTPKNITTTYTYIDREGRLRASYERPKTNTSTFYKLNRFMSYWSHTHIFLKKMVINAFLVRPDSTHTTSPSLDIAKKLKLSKHLISETNKLVEMSNATLVIMFIPAKLQVSESAWRNYESHYPETANRFAPQEELMTYCVVNNIHCLDLLPSFINREDVYFAIDGHWNAQGHHLAAKQLYSYLQEESLIKTS